MIYEKENRYVIAFDDVPTSRAEMPEIEVDERRDNFAEVETGFPEEVALKEAKRCLACRRCLGCALCWAECKPEAIDFSIPDETLELAFDDVILTKGQDNGIEPIPSQLGYDRFANVITDLQAEQMLSATGPTGGLILSPSDGEIPARIAMVQGHSDSDDPHLLSSLILGVNEAILALSKTDDLQVVLISPISNTFKQEYLAEAEKIKGLRIAEGFPVSVETSEEESMLTLAYDVDGKQHREEIDLVIVLTKPKISPEVQALSKKIEKDEGA